MNKVGSEGIMKKRRIFDKNYVWLFLVSICLLIPLMGNHYFEGHDTGYHIANILAISENLSFHNLLNLKVLPIIAGNLGYGSGIFYPSLSHIIPAIIHTSLSAFNISIFTTMKITHFLVILASGFVMYKFMKTVTKNQKLSFISSLFYLTAPYYLYDYIVRDALAESFIFIWIPLIFLSIYYILNKEYKKFYISFIIGYVGMINTHLIMTIYVTIFVAIILLINWKKIWKKEVMGRFIIATITVILLCLPFIIPLLNHKINGNYTVFAPNEMANRAGVWWNALKPYHYFIGWPKELGFHFLNIVALGFLVYVLRYIKKNKIKIKEDYLLTVGLVCSILGIWMSSMLFPWVIMPEFLLMIQFPFRIGTLTAFGLSIVSYYALTKINNQKRWIRISILSCTIVSVFCFATQTYKTLTQSDYDLSYFGMGYQQEYVPTKTKQNMDYFWNRGEEIIVKEGKASIKVEENKTPDLKFKTTDVKNATLELPRLYYFGYQIKATTEEGKEQEISYIENDKGFIEINLEKDTTIEVIYTGTKMDHIGNQICGITLIGCIIYILFKKNSISRI